MVRIIIVVLCMFSSALFAEELVNGLITASQVDITADDGSLLPDRLNVGDVVYIVNKSGKDKKAGWVRVSKSPDDKIGIGWVEQKHIRTFNSYKDPSGGSSSTANFPSLPSTPPASSMPSVPDLSVPPELSGIPVVPEDTAVTGSGTSADFSSVPVIAAGVYKNVGVVRFTAQTNDSFVASTSENFSGAVFKSTGLKGSVVTDNVKTDSEAALQKITDKYKFDGVFVGNISDPLDDGRLVQVRFYSGKEKKFIVEKVTRIPLSGDSKKMIQNFAQSVVDQLNNPL